jgi:hypothetical protein
MKSDYLVVLTLTLAACGKSQSLDTVDSLVADPTRLREVMRQCRENHAKIDEAECSAATEAFRRNFMGNGKAQYTPQR